MIKSNRDVAESGNPSLDRGSEPAACWGLDAEDFKAEVLKDFHSEKHVDLAGLSKIDGIVIDLTAVHSNIVLFVLSPSDLSEDEFLTGLQQHHVRMIQFGPRLIRAVTHWQISEADVRAAIDGVASVVKQGRSSYIVDAMKHIGLVGNGYGGPAK